MDEFASAIFLRTSLTIDFATAEGSIDSSVSVVAACASDATSVATVAQSTVLITAATTASVDVAGVACETLV